MSRTPMKILVTGSSGMIGTRLCEKLLEKGFTVVGADWKSNRWNKEVNKLTIKVDLRNKQSVLKKLPQDIGMVIHLAANARVHDLVIDPDMARDNFETLFNTLEYARIQGIKKFLFASSREVYGNTGKVKHSEKDVSLDVCESPYTASKMGGECLVTAYGKCYGIDFVITRFSNVYGMYDESNRFIPLLIKQARSGEPITIFGKDKLLDFTYIDDTIQGIILCIEKFSSAKNNVLNLAYGKGATLHEVAELIKGHVPGIRKSKLIFKQNRTGEVVKYIADINKARKLIGYAPGTKIEKGITLSADWYEKNTI